MSVAPASHTPAAASPARFTLDGEIPPRRIPLAYRAGLALTAFAMILLPLVYIALIFLAGWGVWAYAHFGLGVFHGSGGGIWRLVAYVTPLFAGVSLIVFMIKPLFASPPRRAAPLVLDMDQQPALRELIAAICARVRAPVPVEVYVDCQINASASLRRGLLSLGQRDLALTMGLPLAGNLTARQLAGVLAHEFGHFAQGAGMAFTFVIRSVNSWFARVVFERDSWDEQLAEWSEGADARLAIMLGAARLAIWTSRKILHGLMLVGHAIACLQMRQMEFDADYYETHVAGSEAFVESSREMRRLGLVSRSAFGELGDLWREQRLVDDFPGFVARRRAQLTPENAAKIDADHFETKTHWFDTHPSDLDRTVHARALKLPGIFRGDGPAMELFYDFGGLSRIATRHYYQEELELSFEDQALVPVAAAARRGDEASAAEAAHGRLAGTVLNLTRPVVWTEADFAASSAGVEPTAVAQQLAAFRAQLAQHREAAERTEKAFALLREEHDNASAAHAFISAGVDIKPEAFGVIANDLASTERRRTDLTDRLAAKARELVDFESALAGWVRTVVIAARDPAIKARLPEGLAARIDTTANGFVSLAPWFRAFPDWVREHNLVATFRANEAAMSGNQRFNTALSAQRDRTRALLNQALPLVGNAPYPFADATGAPTVTFALNHALEGVYGDGRFVVILKTVASFYFRLIGQIATQGEELERALASGAST